MRLFPSKNTSTNAHSSISLVTLVDQHSPVTEQYRTLRTNIQFLLMDKKMTSMVITSSGPGEGKSTTAANLAVVFASTGSRTLLVDADLRKPTVAKTFLLDHSLGLSNLLSSRSEEEISIEMVSQETKVHNLTAITSGPIPPNPAELIGSNRMAALLEELNTLYDIVVFDMPPVMAVTDAQILAAKVDGTLVVVRENVTKKEELLKTKQLLQLVEANILGTVYNGSERASSSGYYYYGL